MVEEKSAGLTQRGEIIEKLTAGKTDEQLEAMSARVDAFCAHNPARPEARGVMRARALIARHHG